MQLIPCGLVAIRGGALGGRVMLAAFPFWACAYLLESRPGYLVVAERAMQRGENQKPFPFSFIFFYFHLSLRHSSDADTIKFPIFRFSAFFLSNTPHFVHEINGNKSTGSSSMVGSYVLAD
jgi:hypothetical protein